MYKPIIYCLCFVGIISFIAPASAATDTDGDGYTDNEENFLGTDPNDADTDDDGVTDYQEPLLGTDALEYDTITTDQYSSDYTLDNDSDGLSNGYELNDGRLGDVQVGNFTGEGGNPNNADTDEDGLGDWFEATYAGTCVDITISNSDHDDVLDPDEDCDNDGLTNQQEEQLGSNPLVADSDDDGYTDAEEESVGSDPVDEEEDPITILDHGDLVEATGAANGQVILTYADGFSNTATVFSGTTKPKVKLLPDTSGVVVLGKSGRRLKILDEDGAVMDTMTVRQNSQSKIKLRSWDIGSDDIADIVIVSQRKHTIKTSWILYNSTDQLHNKQSLTTRNSASQFTLNRKKRSLRIKSRGETLVRYQLKRDGVLVQRYPSE